MRALASIAVSLAVLGGAFRTAMASGRWGALIFAGIGTAVILAGAGVYAVISTRRERKRLAAERESRAAAREKRWPWVEPAGCGGDVLHVHPRGDLIEHDTATADDGCPCGPEMRPMKRDDGSVGWLICHHSLDGREARQATDGR